MSTQQQLEEAITLIKAGQKEQALPLLKQVVQAEPRNENAWLWLSTCFNDPEKKKFCINKALEINPENQKAHQLLERLEGVVQAEPLAASQPASPAPEASFWEKPLRETTATGEAQADLTRAEVGAIAPEEPDEYARTGRILAWHEVWLKALTSPTEKSYREILNDPSLSFMRGALWLGISYIIAMLISGILFTLFMDQFLAQMDAIAGLGMGTEFPSGFSMGDFRSLMGYIMIGMMVGSPLMAVVSVGMMALYAGFVQLVSRFMIGEGTFTETFYMLTAVAAPYTLLSSLLAIFYAVPGAMMILSCIGLPLTLYSLYLYTLAIKSSQRYGWFSAIIAMLSPAVLIFLCSCLVGLAVSALAPSQGTLLMNWF